MRDRRGDPRVYHLPEETEYEYQLEHGMSDNTKQEEQDQLAREIGEELTDAFIAFVRGDVTFDDLTFGVFDALSDLHTIASGDYELADDDDEDGHDHGDDSDEELEYDKDEAVDEQEELAQEPSR